MMGGVTGRQAPFLAGPAPIVMAHRGFSLAGLENTMAAFEAALRLGIRYLETDVRATRDGVLVTLHDARLDRVSDAHGPVADRTWAQLQQVRIGGVEPVARLEDVLGTWPQARVNVDVKAADAIPAFVDVIRRTGAAPRVCVASFSDRRRALSIRLLREAGIEVAWSPGIRGVSRVVATARATGSPGGVARALAGAACLQIPERSGRFTLITPRLLSAVHAAGAQVHVWTVDETSDMQRLLDLGVDGLITNRADRAREVLIERGQWGG